MQYYLRPIFFDWLPEPGAITNPKPYYATNGRENPGDMGTSKIAVNATVKSSDIGNLRNGGALFSVEESVTYRAIVRLDGDGTYWADGSSVQVNRQTPRTSESREDYFSHQSDVGITGTAGYPFIWDPIVANIDFGINFFLDRRPDCSVDVYISGWRDGFPAYEVMVDDSVVHGYVAPGETGPNLVNLSTRTAVTGFIKIKPH